MNRFLNLGKMTLGGFVIFIGLLGVGCPSTKQTEVSTPPSSAEPDKSKIAKLDGDRFTIGDFVSVTFSGAEGLIPSHQEHIKKDGTITLFLIGAVKADGKTRGELLKEIHERYVPHYYKRLVITIPRENAYYVDGQVSSPGRQVYLVGTAMMKAVQSAGGFTALAAKNRVEVIRASGEKVEVNCFKPEWLNLKIFPGDRIVVPKRGSWDMFQQ